MKTKKNQSNNQFWKLSDCSSNNKTVIAAATVSERRNATTSPLEYIDPHEVLEEERIYQIAPSLKWSTKQLYVNQLP